MREIKFRGVTIDSPKMIYGDLMRTPSGTYIFPPDGLDSVDCYQVDPETVGQFIGLHDKNGKEIYSNNTGKIFNNRKTIKMKTKEIAKQELQPSKLIELAIQKDADIDKLEKLMGLQERWEAKEAKKAFFHSLMRFQEDVPELKKTKEVSYGAGKTQYKYTPLGDIDKQIKSALAEHGLSKRWTITDKKDEIQVTCIISHESGHSEQTTMSAQPDATGSKNPIQSRASTITYLQRYTLIGALGIATADEDIDGQQAPKKKEKESLTPKHKKWDAAKVAIDKGNTTIEQIKKAYDLTKENEKLLCSK